jgi:hypothetical protein
MSKLVGVVGVDDDRDASHRSADKPGRQFGVDALGQDDRQAGVDAQAA